MKKLSNEWIFTGIVAFVVIILLPCLNAFLPVESFLHVSDFSINLYGKYLTYAVLAISVDMLWGYTGLLSLGQCIFFSLGGYALGMYLMLMIGKLGQYHSDLPDFMVFLGYPKLPLHWVPFHSFWLLCLRLSLSSLDSWRFVPGSKGSIFQSSPRH